MIPATGAQFIFRLPGALPGGGITGKVPGDESTRAPVFPTASPLLRGTISSEGAQPGWIETESNLGRPAGADWARMRGAPITPMTNGAATAASAAAARRAFFPKFRRSTMRLVMMASIRFLRFDPVTP